MRVCDYARAGKNFAESRHLSQCPWPVPLHPSRANGRRGACCGGRVRLWFSPESTRPHRTRAWPPASGPVGAAREACRALGRARPHSAASGLGLGAATVGGGWGWGAA